MTADKVQSSSLTPRQKVIAGVIALIGIFIAWQIKGLFSDSGAPPAPAKPVTAANQANGSNLSSGSGAAGPLFSGPAVSGAEPSAAAQKGAPQQATQLAAQQPLSPRELELIKLQQETEAKYIAALGELQLLKISQSIAEANKAIANANLDTVTAQKGVVDLLSGGAPTQPSYAQNLVGMPTSGQAQQQAPTQAQQQQPIISQVSYTVISVTQLQYKWSAVIGNQGTLYSVSIGDRLPPDDSKVIAIDKSGVILEKDGQKRKLSMVPII